MSLVAGEGVCIKDRLAIQWNNGVSRPVFGKIRKVGLNLTHQVILFGLCTGLLGQAERAIRRGGRSKVLSRVNALSLLIFYLH